MENQEPLSAEIVQEYADTLKAHLPDTLQLKITFRSARLGHIIPAGMITSAIAETHSIAEGVLQIYMPDADEEATEGDLITMALVSFPQRRIDYMAIEVLPPKSKISCMCPRFVSVPKLNTQVIPQPMLPREMFAQPLPPTQQRETPTGPTDLTPQVNQGDGTLVIDEGRKRSREEAEEVGDAIRGDQRKRTVCVGLKIPLELTDIHLFLYTPIWHDRIAAGEAASLVALEWKTACMEFVLCTQLQFSLPCKRLEFFALKESVTAWIEGAASSIDPRLKSSWKLPFDLTNKLVSLIGYACGTLSDENDTFTASRTAWTKGFVDYSAILATVKNGQREAPKHQQSQPPQTQYHGSHNSFRGRGRGYRGRGFRGRR
jgi:hypothetical protein